MKAKALSTTEAAWRELRAKMEIKPVIDIYDYTAQRLTMRRENRLQGTREMRPGRNSKKVSSVE